MRLTKTDFIQYCNCPKSLWLLKHKPKIYPHKEFSLFLEKLIKQGAKVEKYAQKLFPDGVSLFEHGPLTKTQEALKKDTNIFFQPAFESKNGAFSRIDILERLDNNTWHLYEVKSSTKIKNDTRHTHLKDTAFQKYVLENNGLKVKKVSIIHLNKEYIRKGEINPHELLKVVDVTEEIKEIYEQVSLEIEEAIKFIEKETISEKFCSCRENTKTNHCDSFEYFNPNIPEYSIYEIGNIRKNKLQLLLSSNILKIEDIDFSSEFNEKQQLQIQSCRRKKEITEIEKIQKVLKSLEFPLHFIDYETVSNAIPKIDGLKPYQHVPFQVSVHTMTKDSRLKHFEYLEDSLELPEKMLKEMEKVTGTNGTYISWHKSFECGRNNEMAVMFPKHLQYLKYMNEHMFDLEDIFKKDYIDYRFHGRTSIKAVLPVLVPELSYKKLTVQDGTMAMDTWERMILDTKTNRVEIRKNLLEYCKLDTLAMVEIYRKLAVL